MMTTPSFIHPQRAFHTSLAAALVAVFCGPALLKKFADKPKEAVDLSSFNIVTSYETPAIQKMDSTLRIEFCQA